MDNFSDASAAAPKRASADGITTKRLHTWPDVVGEKIDPLRKAA